MSANDRDRAVPRLGHRPHLDVLRGIAVLAVITLHLGLVAGGYIGVDMFFVLSGFLITALLYEESDRMGSISLRRFYGRRIARLLPALLLLLMGFALIVVLLHPFTGIWPLDRLTAVTLLCLNNWVTALVPRHGQVLGALVPTWTLAEEVQFYLIWPAFLRALLRRGVSPRGVLIGLGVAMLMLLGGAELLRYADPVYNAYTSPLDRGAELLLGCGAAIIWRERRTPRVICGYPARGLIAGAILWLLLAASIPHRRWYLSGAALTALLILNLLSDARPQGHAAGRLGPLRSDFVLRPLAYVGTISYGLYLFHLPIYYTFWTYAPGQSRYLYAPIVIGGSLAAASASWRFIEAPILRRTRKGITRPRSGRKHARSRYSLALGLSHKSGEL